MGIRRTRESYNAYMREYHLKRYYRIRKAAIRFLGGKCVVCGTKKKLRFDHQNPKNKKIDVSRLLSVSKKRFWKEIKKCQLLCHEHHNEKTLKERGLQNARKIHGTLSSYYYCKCDLCKKAKSEYNKAYRRRRSQNGTAAHL